MEFGTIASGIVAIAEGFLIYHLGKSIKVLIADYPVGPQVTNVKNLRKVRRPLNLYAPGTDPCIVTDLPAWICQFNQGGMAPPNIYYIVNDAKWEPYFENDNMEGPDGRKIPAFWITGWSITKSYNTQDECTNQFTFLHAPTADGKVTFASG